ncbi:LysR substrate-binding domain-containing protein [Achromobacter aloeverae]
MNRPPGIFASPPRPRDGQRRLRITLRQLEVFVAIAKERSTRAAADSVSRSQSAASSALVELEATMATPLFDRRGRRLILNEAGARLLPAAVSLLEQAAEFEGVLEDYFCGPLKIAATASIAEYLLPEILAKWRTSHPSSPVRVLVSNATGVFDALQNLQADVGFVDNTECRPGMSVASWFGDQMVVVAAVGHPLLKKTVTIDALRSASWAMIESGSGSREAAERWLVEHLGPINIDFEVGAPQAVVALVASGAAVGCLPRYAVARCLRSGDIRIVSTPLPPLEHGLKIATNSAKRLASTGHVFIAHCVSATKLYRA